MSTPTRSRAVVSGGAGFLGSHLCERLLADGYDVVCLDNLLTGTTRNIETFLADDSFRFVEADVCEPCDDLGSIDLVLHFASPASPVDYLRFPLETMEVGSTGTRRMLELAERHRARFVLASTSEAYGDPEVHPQKESYWGNVNPIGPRSVYDEAKRYAEALTMAYRRTRGVDGAIVRIFNTMGPRMRADDGRAVPTFISQALCGAPLTVAGDGSQTRSLQYVDDLVEGVCRLANSSEAGPINIGNPEEISMLELAHLVKEVSRSSSPIEFVPLPADDPRRRRPDITIAKNLLGWEPKVSMVEGLGTTIEWFRGKSEDGPTGRKGAVTRHRAPAR